MRLTIAAVGRLKSGPEADLVTDYAGRCTATGRALGLGPLEVREIDERKARDVASQSSRLSETIGDGACRIVLDERGRMMPSQDLAALLARERDDGRAEMAFLIGGADGHSEDLRRGADRLLSFGPMVWPHMLVRVMLAEQLYRAVSILAGTPYHRA